MTDKNLQCLSDLVSAIPDQLIKQGADPLLALVACSLTEAGELSYVDVASDDSGIDPLYYMLVSLLAELARKETDSRLAPLVKESLVKVHRTLLLKIGEYHKSSSVH